MVIFVVNVIKIVGELVKFECLFNGILNFNIYWFYMFFGGLRVLFI